MYVCAFYGKLNITTVCHCLKSLLRPSDNVLGRKFIPKLEVTNTLCCNVTLDLCYWYMSTTKFVKSINRPPPYKYDAYVCWLYAESPSYIKCIEIIPLFTHFLVIDQYCK